MTVQALTDQMATPPSRKEAERATNMFALGMLSWLYHRPTEVTERFLRTKFAATPQLLEANQIAFRAGWAFGETTESFAVSYEVAPAPVPPGTYRNITGNVALAYGLVAAAYRSGLRLRARLLPDHAGLGHPAHAVPAQALRRDHDRRPRTRSPGSARHSAPPTAGRSA